MDGVATARVVSELDRTRQRLFIVQVRGTSGISGKNHPGSHPYTWNKDFLLPRAPKASTTQKGDRKRLFYCPGLL